VKYVDEPSADWLALWRRILLPANAPAAHVKNVAVTNGAPDDRLARDE
jgi:hypothetical protein